MKQSLKHHLISMIAASAVVLVGAAAEATHPTVAHAFTAAGSPGASLQRAGLFDWGSGAKPEETKPQPQEEPTGPQAPAGSAAPTAGAPAAASLPSFAGVAAIIQPAVVNVSTTQNVHPPKRGAGPHPSIPFDENDPFQQFFRHFFEQPGPGGVPEEPQRALGSGVIIDPSGYIVTNAHVVQGADKITVKLKNDRELTASVVGIDEKTDVALLKVKSKEPLPAATLGDSDKLQVGDWVIAVGNPFGLSETITAGIVSAKGRVIGAGPYDDFIQTDASINPGNSGGPLVNLQGRVVGINAVIYSQSGGNIGIGFAIPINLVRSIVDQLKEHGKVVRGYLGVGIQQVTPDMASALKLEHAHGALVGNVYPDGPAAKAGIKVGDVIVGFDGKKIESAHQLPTIVADTPVGSTAQVDVLRNGKSQQFTVTIAEMPAQKAEAESPTHESTWGLTAAPIDARAARRFNLEKREGVVVTDVTQGGPADEAGLRPGDVIVRVGQTEIASMDDYNKAVDALGDADRMLVLIARGSDTFFAVLQRGG